MEHKKGSMLVITIVSILVLSLMVTGLLTVGSTEIYTTHNYQLNRSAYYTAVEGMEEVRNMIRNNPDAEYISSIYVSLDDSARYDDKGVRFAYMTGTLKDLEAITLGGGTTGFNGTGYTGSGTGSGTSPIKEYKEVDAPQLPGSSITMGGTSAASFSTMIWKIRITSQVTAGRSNKKVSYAELVAGVFSIAMGGY
jgi:hypothetical protein